MFVGTTNSIKNYTTNIPNQHAKRKTCQTVDNWMTAVEFVLIPTRSAHAVSTSWFDLKKLLEVEIDPGL